MLSRSLPGRADDDPTAKLVVVVCAEHAAEEDEDVTGTHFRPKRYQGKHYRLSASKALAVALVKGFREDRE